MEEHKQLTPRVYNLNKEELQCQYQKRNLSTKGNFSTLRERLVKAVKRGRDTGDSVKPSLTLPREDASRMEGIPSAHSDTVISLHDENQEARKMK